ncbi:MAG TPA: hypothetical protein VI814_00015 [Candidatus Limnocylindria bacterium]
MTTVSGVRKHVLASANLFIGASNFLVIALPERYNIGGTINPPEVAGTHAARGAAWVLDGRCSHYVRDTSSRTSLEILVQSWRGETRSPKWMGEAREIVIAQHDARLATDAIRVGFPRRRTMARLRAAWSCERTKRSLELELLGPEDVDLSPIADAIVLSECH